ncbi:sorting nexin-29 [Nematostella vectensis]|uniref:sorting nexin-29 n=1 Tax=Nematostella vectensis TaxID=45351 RepID=UPI0013905E77|nr:sorting nexin-29 [Nematostella vectensis]
MSENRRFLRAQSSSDRWNSKHINDVEKESKENRFFAYIQQSDAHCTMFLTSPERDKMNASSASDGDRQNLLERLLDAVKQCQVRFGGKTELATDGDSRVTCLLAQLENILQHGMKKPKGTARAFRQVSQVAGLMKQDVEPVFWNFIVEHLGKMEKERFTKLQNITTDAGRGRAWLRSTLNEHTLEKTFHTLIGDPDLLSNYYDHHAFLRDTERASMLPMMAAGLSSILFALGIDKEDLNAVKPAPHVVQTSKEVFANILSSFPNTNKPKTDHTPAPVYSGNVSDVDKKTDKKKKKPRKKVVAAIASIEEGEGSVENLNETGCSDFVFSKGVPLTDAYRAPPSSSKSKGHTRSSSYPGKITTGISHDSTATSLPKAPFLEQFSESGEFSRQISLSDTSLSKDTVNWSNDGNSDGDFKVGKTTFYTGQAVNTVEEMGEYESGESTPNFRFGFPIINDATLTNTVSFDDDPNEFSRRQNASGSRENEQEQEQGSSSSNFSKTFKYNPGLSSETSGVNEHGSEWTGYSVDELEDQEMDVDSLDRKFDPRADSFTVIGSGESLTPVKSKGSSVARSRTGEPVDRDVSSPYKEDGESSRDNISMSSNSWIDEEECPEQRNNDFLIKGRSNSLTAATEAAVAALEICAHAQSDQVSSMTRTLGDGSANTNEESGRSRHDSMTTSELKQAIVSMMLRKDEIEEQNRTLRQLMEEKRREIEGLRAEANQLRHESKTREERESSTIAALTRENEVLKHQLKKYVSAVQLLRSDMAETQFNDAAATLGIRQDETIPKLPEKSAVDDTAREEANEYKKKLIQVAEMHGELMEFNQRVQKQTAYWQHQTRRMREELINLRGPLPEDCCSADVDANLEDFDPAIVAANSRPLISVWIPSVFMRGKGSSGVHLYQVYIRIKDDEWNVYRRYSQFHDLHKKLCKKRSVVGSFKFPPKKTLGNKGTKFVEERRKHLQDYIRRIVNLLTTTDEELSANTNKAILLKIVPFFGDPYPPDRDMSEMAPKRKRGSDPYNGL